MIGYRILQNTDAIDLKSELFPEFSKRKNQFINTPKRVDKMCEKVENSACRKTGASAVDISFQNSFDSGILFYQAADALLKRNGVV